MYLIITTRCYDILSTCHLTKVHLKNLILYYDDLQFILPLIKWLNLFSIFISSTKFHSHEQKNYVNEFGFIWYHLIPFNSVQYRTRLDNPLIEWFCFFCCRNWKEELFHTLVTIQSKILLNFVLCNLCFRLPSSSLCRCLALMTLSNFWG